MVTIYNDVRHHGKFARLDLEVAHRKPIFRVAFNEGRNFLGICIENLAGRNSAFQLGCVEIAASLDQRDATNTPRRFADAPSTRRKEGELDLVLRM